MNFAVAIPTPGSRATGQPGPAADMNAVLAALAEIRTVMLGLSTSAPATIIRLRAVDGGVWDITPAADGVLITTSVSRDSLGASDNFQLLAPDGTSTYSYTVGIDGVLNYTLVVP